MLIQPDHHKCYFYEGYFDHKKIIKFLSDKEKAFIRPFDAISLEMHQFYDLPIVVLFRDNDDSELMKIYEEVATHFHDHYFFTYVD